MKKYLLLFFVTISLSGCFMEREVIPSETVAMFSYTDFMYFDQDGGVSEKILPSGKQEFSSGYNKVYLISKAQQHYDLGTKSIMMKEKIGRDFKVSIGYKVKLGQYLRLLLNYITEEDIKKISNDDKGIDKVLINLDSIFKRNILELANEVIMDTIDGQSLYIANTQELSENIKDKVTARLLGAKKPEIILDGNKISLSTRLVSIADLIEVNSINIRPGGMPDVVNEQIELVTKLQADLKAANNDLSIEKTVKKEEMLAEATNMKSQNDELATIYSNPKLKDYKRYQQLKKLVTPKYDDKGNVIVSDSKTTITFYQGDLTADNLSDIIKSTK